MVEATQVMVGRMIRPRVITEDDFKVLLGNMEKVRGGVVGTREVPRPRDINHGAARRSFRKDTVTVAGANPAPSPKREFDSAELVLVGQIKSGKNRILITRTGHRYPPKEFQVWRDAMVADFVKQWKQPAITEPVRLHCQYWPGDRRTRDVSGMEDALFHVLVRAGVLKDDGLVYDCLWYRQPMNRKGPKVLITITNWG